MPLLEIRKINPHTLLGRWQLTETVSQLQQHAGLPVGLLLPKTLTHEKRQTEWLASRILAYQLLQILTPAYYQLQNDINGRPCFMNSSYRVSISHTQHVVAVLVSDRYGVGIDIETVKPKVLRVRDKFLAPAERQALGDDLTKLTIAWSAKETLYKLYGSKNVVFAENLLLSSFTLATAGAFEAVIQTNSFQQKYTVYFESETDIILTYCLDDNL